MLLDHYTTANIIIIPYYRLLHQVCVQMSIHHHHQNNNTATGNILRRFYISIVIVQSPAAVLYILPFTTHITPRPTAAHLIFTREKGTQFLVSPFFFFFHHLDMSPPSSHSSSSAVTHSLPHHPIRCYSTTTTTTTKSTSILVTIHLFLKYFRLFSALFNLNAY